MIKPNTPKLIYSQEKKYGQAITYSNLSFLLLPIIVIIEIGGKADERADR